jgi:hypothetical protein
MENSFTGKLRATNVSAERQNLHIDMPEKAGDESFHIVLASLLMRKNSLGSVLRSSTLRTVKTSV